ncbi:putative gal4 dna-binding enhancer protein [Vairimorpha apis BRL 01]|uniref:Putative gal4 dna-binding enhancer protein n=1 Tax=Vairimorpha apis BRL 01 TaxID=1037528 RepID=T0L9F5_9MICR|nr:putative gal4 dna-binding enhancer protein [Vairimorpha apis BRL 01]
MSRSLTDSEQKFIDKLSNFKLKKTTDYSNISLSAKKQKFFVHDPVLYEIEDTSGIVILGEIRQTFNINMLKKLYEEQMKLRK